MVLESLIKAKNAEEQHLRIFFLGILYSSVAIIVTNFIFNDENASIIVVTLTLIASIPLMYKVIRLEEKKASAIKSEASLLKEHGKAILFYSFLFLGFIVSFAAWYTLLPYDTINNLFSMQTKTFESINQDFRSSAVTGSLLSRNYYFDAIFLHNLKVLGFSILFSLLYGAGAIFILIWNASVIGAAAGVFARENLSTYAQQFGFFAVGNYFSSISMGLFNYALHGVPEMMGYFLGALAGGIISFAVIKKEFKLKVILDSALLLVISIVFLFVAYLIEAATIIAGA